MSEKKVYFDRDYLYEVGKNNITHSIDLNTLMRLPTSPDIIEVVRCRNCEFNRGVKYGLIDCRKSIRFVSPEHFCGYGKKR